MCQILTIIRHISEMVRPLCVYVQKEKVPEPYALKNETVFRVLDSHQWRLRPIHMKSSTTSRMSPTMRLQGAVPPHHSCTVPQQFGPQRWPILPQLHYAQPSVAQIQLFQYILDK